jgi:pyridoxal phosphate enzyme (YggS family)
MSSESLSAHADAHGSPAPTNGTPKLSTPGQDAQSRLDAVRQRIRAACDAAGRPHQAVQLLAVSKTFGIDDIRALAELGQTAFGENYLQEALGKIEAASAQAPTGSDDRPGRGPGETSLSVRQSLESPPERPLEWHFIGPIQSNKTRQIAEHFDWVHSIDRLKIASRLAEQRPAGRGPLQVCLQIDVSNEDSKSGCSPAEAPALAVQIAALQGLLLRGVMAIPAPTDDPVAQRAQFRRVRETYEMIRKALPGPAARAFDTLSMGMSGDLEAAIDEGATLVRVGTALFGTRPARP